MTASHNITKTQVLGRIPIAVAEAALTAGGLPVTWRDPGDPDKLAFQGKSAPVWLIRDLATGNLTLTGAPEDLPKDLPRPSVAEIIGLLLCNDPVENLAGLQAAEGREEADLLTPIVALSASADPVISDRAREVLTLNAVAVTLLARSDAAAALFSLPGWRREKLQIMRWWMQEPPSDPGTVEAAIDRALTDPDWEIAVTAMLAAGRLRLSRLSSRVRRLTLPDRTQQGVAPAEARLLLALRDACLRRLGQPVGKASPPGIAELLEGDPDHLPPDFRDFAAALLLPLPVGTAPPEVEGILSGAGGPRLADGRLLCWVPPGVYRLGTPYPLRHSLPNPRHLFRLSQGFFIDAEPRPAAPLSTAIENAAEIARTLSHRVALPSPAMWEAAMRGADGRRFPWGTNAAMRMDQSPFGLTGMLGGPGEWLAAEDGVTAIWAGGKDGPIPAHHFVSRGSESRAYRYVFMIQVLRRSDSICL
ncbi:hypothetical protein JJJ17_11140 [Paracoccus caeni]|uniref:Sulfatase-modifying factor enzyme domain-containing protein n=1 Tax=Paracoccus caeni TaxID=657651 RepID=A0A934VV31_9RHOB|nr:hypothetical protein [Paracoccus caeni]MBK4216481.1 hypothetical protein [Paracoccus caeni]